jgi:simple sugar transport system permease protein
MASDASPTQAPEASSPDNTRQRKSFTETLLNVRELAPSLGLLAVVLFFTLQTANFWSPQTMTAISTVASTIAIVAVGVTMLMICGEFDLSVGQNFAFTPIVWAILFVTNGVNEWLGLIIALGFAACVGVVNGLVTTAFGIPSFITTLGMFFVLEGLNNLLISGHQLIMFGPSRAMSALGARIGSTPFYMPLVWMFIIACALWFLLTRLRYGNWTFATGGKVGPAKAMGVPTRKVKRINFVLSAFFAGLAGCMQFAYIRGVTQGQGQNYELLAITAAVLGGTSLFGGAGTIWGSVIGAFLLSSIQTGLVLVGVPGSFYVTFIGVMLVIVVIANVRLGRFGNNQG